MSGSAGGRGRGRGILALTDYKPVRRPGQAPSTAQAPAASSSQMKLQSAQEQQARSQINGNGRNPAKAQAPAAAASAAVAVPTVKGREAMAKYTYNENRDSPLGKEVSLRQGEKILVFYEHANPQFSEHWVTVETESGARGFVPKTYVYVADGGLPWLQNKKLETKAEPTNDNITQPSAAPASKQAPTVYKAAYSDNQVAGDGQYGCKICGKTFNGPAPYNSHMRSKAHKEMVEDDEWNNRRV